MDANYYYDKITENLKLIKDDFIKKELTNEFMDCWNIESEIKYLRALRVLNNKINKIIELQ